MARLHSVTYIFPSKNTFSIHLFLSRSFFVWNWRSSRILKLYNTLFYALIAIFIEDFCEQWIGHRHILPYISFYVFTLKWKCFFFFASPSTQWKSRNQQQKRHTIEKCWKMNSNRLNQLTNQPTQQPPTKNLFSMDISTSPCNSKLRIHFMSGIQTKEFLLRVSEMSLSVFQYYKWKYSPTHQTIAIETKRE